MLIPEVELVDQVELLEKAEGTVDSGEAHPLAAIVGAAVDLFRIEMLSRLLDNREEGSPLGGHASPRGVDCTARCRVELVDRLRCHPASLLRNFRNYKRNLKPRR